MNDSLLVGGNNNHLKFGGFYGRKPHIGGESTARMQGREVSTLTAYTTPSLAIEGEVKSAVTQMVECLTFNSEVEGSSPSCGNKFYSMAHGVTSPLLYVPIHPPPDIRGSVERT